ncbi:DUF5343 domain-containing protein [Saccharopolyspora sp. TS4A08]|uniref:DUF5343 domain-containing protein n=2 Tax=Saccharopolyspora TaxID=1835 RepID=A0A1I6UJS8_9PSEU|nr:MULTISPECIES: DUF5343 domain-containing protein [Saccharopolyspora]MDI2029506.1 DUF5343 domain-containing protein [Saccharopolyspora sp. TS4A08]SFT01683.1 hypothetical protein SAMN05660874_04987 [Saccharopolyspora flava]
MAQNKETTFTPPYATFRNFLNSLDKMAQQPTLPAAIDRSYLRWMPGSTQTGYLGMCRQFGLIDEDGAPTDLLRELVYDPDSRPKKVKELILRHYAPIVEFGSQHTTSQQLLDKWTETFGQHGDTRRKASTFFLHAAEYAGIPVSPEWKHIATTSRKRSPGTRRARRTTKAEEPTAPTGSSGATRIRLKSGGSITLSVDVNLLELSVEDREFVIKLIDAVHDYQSRTGQDDLADDIPSQNSMEE